MAPEGWEPRLAAHAAGESPFKFARTKDGISLIAAERQRQVTGEGWTAEHDRSHQQGILARAAACYAWYAATGTRLSPLNCWPWDDEHWKPGDELRSLVKAGALIAAEIDRLLAAGEVTADGS
jgi:hypothetical protein